MIVIYGKNNCGACVTTKAYLEGNGLVENEDFEYRNIDENEVYRDHVMRNYFMLPATEYNSKNIVGFEKDELDEVIEEWRHANTTN